MQIVHSEIKKSRMILDRITLDLLNHPAQFKVVRRDRTIATQGNISIQLCGETGKAMIYLSCRKVWESSLADFEAHRLSNCPGWGWRIGDDLLGPS